MQSNRSTSSVFIKAFQSSSPFLCVEPSHGYSCQAIWTHLCYRGMVFQGVEGD